MIPNALFVKQMTQNTLIFDIYCDGLKNHNIRALENMSSGQLKIWDHPATCGGLQSRTCVLNLDIARINDFLHCKKCLVETLKKVKEFNPCVRCAFVNVFIVFLDQITKDTAKPLCVKLNCQCRWNRDKTTKCFVFLNNPFYLSDIPH